MKDRIVTWADRHPLAFAVTVACVGSVLTALIGKIPNTTRQRVVYIHK